MTLKFSVSLTAKEIQDVYNFMCDNVNCNPGKIFFIEKEYPSSDFPMITVLYFNKDNKPIKRAITDYNGRRTNNV